MDNLIRSTDYEYRTFVFMHIRLSVQYAGVAESIVWKYIQSPIHAV